MEFLNFKSKEKINTKNRQKLTDGENLVNLQRVAEDFAQGVCEDRKELFKCMKLAKGEERNAYITFNKLITDGAAFMFNRVKCEVEAIKNATAVYYNELSATNSNSSNSGDRYVDTRMKL